MEQQAYRDTNERNQTNRHIQTINNAIVSLQDGFIV